MVKQILNNAFQNLDTIFPGMEAVDDCLYKITNPFLKYYFLKYYDPEKENKFMKIPPDSIKPFNFYIEKPPLIYPWLGRRQEIQSTEPLYFFSLNYNIEVAESTQKEIIHEFNINLYERLEVDENSVLFHDPFTKNKKDLNIKESLIQTLLPLTLSSYGYFTIHESLSRIPRPGTPDIIAFKDKDLSEILNEYDIPNPLPLDFYSNLEWAKFINEDSLKSSNDNYISVIEVKDTIHYGRYKKQLYTYCEGKIFRKAYGCSALFDKSLYSLEDLTEYKGDQYGFMYFDKSGFHVIEDQVESRADLQIESNMIDTFRQTVVHLLLCNLTLEQIFYAYNTGGNFLDLINKINSIDSLNNIANILDVWFNQ